MYERDARSRLPSGHGKAFRETAKNLTNKDPDMETVKKAWGLPDLENLDVRPCWTEK